MKSIWVARCGNCGEDVFSDKKPTEIEACICGTWNTPSRFKKAEVADVKSEKP